MGNVRMDSHGLSRHCTVKVVYRAFHCMASNNYNIRLTSLASKPDIIHIRQAALANGPTDLPIEY